MKTILTTLCFLLLTSPLLADSFLTTTPFSEAYQDVKIVRKAKKVKTLNKKLIKYLLNKKKSIDVKLAIINQLGWNIKGQDNFDHFLDYILKKKLYENYMDLTKKADADLLACIAYLKAMDDYSNVREAKSLARSAKYRDRSNSFSIHLIYTLIEAQEYQMRDRWCKAFQTCNNLKLNENLNQDMRIRAMEIVFEYADGYEKYC